MGFYSCGAQNTKEEATAAPEVSEEVFSGVIDAQKLKSLLEENSEIVVIDVRTPQEIEQGKLKGALTIDYRSDKFEAEIAKLDKSKKYALYCKSGGRSGRAYDKMKDMGFTQLVDLEGGFTAWESAGYPVEK